MRFLVRVFINVDGKVVDVIHDFDTLDSAKDYADFKANDLRKRGYKLYSVTIYELTDY